MGAETVAEARDRIMTVAYDKGGPCPCCDQFVKVYPRLIHVGMARQLIAAWRAVRDGDPFQWWHMPTVVGHGGDLAKARYWRLLEEQPDVLREDGGKAGWWRFTELGARWVQGQAAVPRTAYVYNGTLLSLEGEARTIRDALGKHFDLRELLQPAPAAQDRQVTV